VLGGTRRADTGGVTSTTGALTRQQAVNPMSGLQQFNTPRSCSVTGTFGELQVTAALEHVVVDVQSRNYNTVGHLLCEHALVKLPLATAMRLRDLLDQAIETSQGILDAAQPGLWSNNTAAFVAGEVWRLGGERHEDQDHPAIARDNGRVRPVRNAAHVASRGQVSIGTVRCGLVERGL
jgi:hypothetical protein